MTSMFWATMLVVTVNAILFHAMPRFSRPDILFAVTVPDAFVAGAGRSLVSRYRAIVWSGTAAALAISLLLPAPQPGSGRGALLMMGVVAGNMVVALAAWLLAHRKARAHAVRPSDVRVASFCWQRRCSSTRTGTTSRMVPARATRSGCSCWAASTSR
jgi:hypothetical protein